MSHDYSEHMEQPKDDLYGRLYKLIEAQTSLERQIKSLEQELEEKTKELDQIRDKVIPELMMNEMRLEEAKLEDGRKLKIKKTIRASLPKDPELRGRAFAWLETNGHGGLIKDEFKAKFGKNEHDEADKLASSLDEMGIPYERKLDIHNQTLCAFLREQLREGTDVPLEVFGAFEQKRAEIK